MSASQQWEQDSSVVDITCEKGLRNFAFKLLKFQPGLACGQCNSKSKSYTLLCLPMSFYQILLSGISLTVRDQSLPIASYKNAP